tara:strand:- start:1145 stop:1372 length:228 start_codon:yes stop_codon:yes gene_type:complete
MYKLVIDYPANYVEVLSVNEPLLSDEVVLVKDKTLNFEQSVELAKALAALLGRTSSGKLEDQSDPAYKKEMGASK